MFKPNPYSGPERRVHKIYVTRNTEYHVRKDVCVAVKSRRSEEWDAEHSAVRKRLEGVIKPGALLPLPGNPAPGLRMYFANGSDEIITSIVVAVLRPPKSIVSQYPPVR